MILDEMFRLTSLLRRQRGRCRSDLYVHADDDNYGGMQTVIEKLKDQGIRDQFKVMVGGSPISKKFADDIGAEGYSVNAVEAVKVAKELTGIAR